MDVCAVVDEHLLHSGGGGIGLVQALQKQLNPTTHQIGTALHFLLYEKFPNNLRIVLIEKRDYYAHWPALIVSQSSPPSP